MINRYLELLNKIQSTPPSNKNSNVLIIDGTNTFIRVFSNVPALNDNGDHVGGVVGFLRSIGALIRKELPTRCIIIFDGKGGSQRRRKIYPEYKGNRKPTSSFNRFSEFKDLQDEKESMKRQFIRIFEYLNTLPVTTITIDNIEADDTIAYLVHHFKQFNSKITISSTDRDFLQLVTDNVTVWNPVKKISYTKEIIQNEFGFLSENYLIYRVLTGDSSDNIPGIKGLGLKTILKKYPEFKTMNIDIDSFLNMNSKLAESKSKSKLITSILDCRQQLELNYKLMQLQISNISGTSGLAIINAVSNIKPLNKKEFLKLYFEDGLNLMIKDPHDWLYNTFNRMNVYAE